MNVEIVQMLPDDAEAVAGLSGQLGYPATTEQMRRRIEELSPEMHGLFVARSESGEVIGWIHVQLITHLQSGISAEIGGLLVAEGYRSHGVGTAFLRRAEAWARSHGLPKIRVRSNVIRENAHRFYEREGYTRTKTSAVFEKHFE